MFNILYEKNNPKPHKNTSLSQQTNKIKNIFILIIMKVILSLNYFL